MHYNFDLTAWKDMASPAGIADIFSLLRAHEGKISLDRV